MADPSLLDQLLSALGVGGTGTGGFAVWQSMKLKQDFADYKVDQAEKMQDYVKHKDLDEMKSDIRDIKNFLMKRDD